PDLVHVVGVGVEHHEVRLPLQRPRPRLVVVVVAQDTDNLTRLVPAVTQVPYPVARLEISHASSSLTIRCTSCKTDACSAPRDLHPHADSPTRLPDDPTRAEPVRDRSRSRATRYRRRSCRPGTRNRHRSGSPRTPAPPPPAPTRAPD